MFCVPFLRWTCLLGSKLYRAANAQRSTAWRCTANASRRDGSATKNASASIAATRKIASCIYTRPSSWLISGTRVLLRECLPSSLSADVRAKNHNAARTTVNATGRESSALRNASAWCARTGNLTLTRTSSILGCRLRSTHDGPCNWWFILLTPSFFHDHIVKTSFISIML